MHEDPFLVEFVKKGGIANYGRFCILLELMAAQELSDSTRGTYTFHRSTLRECLSLKEKNLNIFLEDLQNILKMFSECSEHLVVFSYDKLLKYIGSYNSSVPNKRKENKIKENISSNTETSSVKSPPIVKKLSPKRDAPTNKLWDAYKQKFFAVYGIDPGHREKEINFALSSILKRCGDQSIAFIEHYLSMDCSFYSENGHKLQLAVKDMNKILISMSQPKEQKYVLGDYGRKRSAESKKTNGQESS